MFKLVSKPIETQRQQQNNQEQNDGLNKQSMRAIEELKSEIHNIKQQKEVSSTR